jgi:serine/threonine-protein kinase
MNGTGSSYFVGLLWPTIYAYRLGVGFAPALTIAMVGSIGYVTLTALELAGRMPYAPLLMGEAPAAYFIPDYRSAAVFGVVLITVGSFQMSNVLVWVLRERGRALDRARDELRRAVDQARLGRLSGSTLSHYRIEDLLGRGGMGEVYVAKDKQGREVAVKVLHAHLGEEPEMRARFRREAEVVQRMPPSTVARVHEFGTNPEGYDYIVMERLRGEDLGALLRRRERLPLAELVPIIEKVAQGLDAAHALGVVHRDLKPQNVFLCAKPAADGGPDVRLLDFGVARLHEAQAATAMTATAAVIGTPGYMAPEQATGGTAATVPASHVFSLGCIGYRALTGQPAYPSRNAARRSSSCSTTSRRRRARSSRSWARTSMPCSRSRSPGTRSPATRAPASWPASCAPPPTAPCPTPRDAAPPILWPAPRRSKRPSPPPLLASPLVAGYPTSRRHAPKSLRNPPGTPPARHRPHAPRRAPAAPAPHHVQRVQRVRSRLRRTRRRRR